MTPLTLTTIYLLAICTIAIIVWAFSATRLHKERINNLNCNDKIKVCTDIDAIYIKRIDHNTHRVKIDSTVHDVNFKDIVKILSVTILLMITTTGYSQFLNLDWPRANVKYQNRDKELIWSAPDYLEYKVKGGYIAYEFTDKVCTAAYICLDSIAGDSLINSHLYKNWQPDGLNQWLYYAGYDEPVKVSADWYGQTVIFKYTLKD